MTSRRFVIAAAVVAVIALAGVVTFAALRARSSDDSERSSATTITTTAPPLTTIAPQTIPVPPLPPAGPTSAPPPAITVPPGGTVGTAPPSTTPPTVTATPASTTTPSTGTTKPTTSTTKPTTSTTKPATSTTKPNKVTRRTVVYTPPGAPKLKGDLVLPRQHQDTIIVLVHGGDGSTGSRKQMRGWSDFYATHAYASLAIDYLLVKPGTPPPVYPKPENDVKTAVQYLRTNADQLGINADRVIVQGFDAGAALGAQALVGDAPAAFIGFSGLYDGTQKDPTRYYGGPPNSPDPEVQQRYAAANSIAQAGSAAGPALLYADENGDAAAKQSATSFRDALQSAGKDVTLTLAPGASGAFDQQAAQQVLEWLQSRFPPSSS